MQSFRIAQYEQIGQQTQGVPASGNPPKCAQIGLMLVAAQQRLQRRFKGPFAEIGQLRPLLRQADQLGGQQGTFENSDCIGNPICRAKDQWFHGRLGPALFSILNS